MSASIISITAPSVRDRDLLYRYSAAAWMEPAEPGAAPAVLLSRLNAAPLPVTSRLRTVACELRPSVLSGLIRFNAVVWTASALNPEPFHRALRVLISKRQFPNDPRIDGVPLNPLAAAIHV